MVNLPRCPDCDSVIEETGQCLGDDCDYEVPVTFAPDRNPGSLSDSDYEKTVTVESEIVAEEYSELITYANQQVSIPYVYIAAKYPTGQYNTMVPMFSKGLPFRMGRLEYVYLLERGTILAVYTRQSDPDMAVEVEITSDEFEAYEWTGRKRSMKDKKDVLWRADDQDTTHPMDDIEFPEEDF